MVIGTLPNYQVYSQQFTLVVNMPPTFIKSLTEIVYIVVQKTSSISLASKDPEGD
jgi:hypothetical protein